MHHSSGGDEEHNELGVLSGEGLGKTFEKRQGRFEQEPVTQVGRTEYPAVLASKYLGVITGSDTQLSTYLQVLAQRTRGCSEEEKRNDKGAEW